MTINRRSLLLGAGSALFAAPFLAIEQAAAQIAAGDISPALAAAQKESEAAHMDLMNIDGIKMHGNEKVAMLLYPGFTALDLVGPHFFFACMMGAKVDLVTTQDNLDPVASDLQLAIAPTAKLEDIGGPLDIMFVPGGTMGTAAVMADQRSIDWIAKQAETARYVTSVCTGSMILGKAGLLKGRRATSHWGAHAILPDFGAIAVDKRVVVDGNIITGAGVSAGLDFGLSIVAALRGKKYAEALRLQAEYAPEPPVAGGTLATTDPAVANAMNGMFAATREQFRGLAL
ncbi:DJ-1/PfpI family protein [Parasphingorhabdus cellanae]|uniref:DJ-1/PfpI family protein n=1 Tax=Parasphingorhabdus cellanae TaxID=2806553 RepID=A0ABX7T3E7_9SPHN|nr:DJ-1/PfpI family protein [Parasphingorhabdus cellanae]QTD56091.1 DJ-1/PfpI family protein [Parasphingorhabdus cellanae]